MTTFYSKPFNILAKEISLWFRRTPVYESKLEEYIMDHHPKNTSDVDRLTRQYDTEYYGYKNLD